MSPLRFHVPVTWQLWTLLLSLCDLGKYIFELDRLVISLSAQTESELVKRIGLTAIVIVLMAILLYKGITTLNWNWEKEVGQVVDSFNNVSVYYNGGVGNVSGRHVIEGYNLGLKYQCVEFVKRYYFEFYHHKMPDTYGHAKDFFDAAVIDGGQNAKRDLVQYTNPSFSQPQPGDLLVMGPTLSNPYGHVAIISKVQIDSIEIIQQNPGPFSDSRKIMELNKTPDDTWRIENGRVLGWLRKASQGKAPIQVTTEGR